MTNKLRNDLGQNIIFLNSFLKMLDGHDNNLLYPLFFFFTWPFIFFFFFINYRWNLHVPLSFFDYNFTTSSFLIFRCWLQMWNMTFLSFFFSRFLSSFFSFLHLYVVRLKTGRSVTISQNAFRLLAILIKKRNPRLAHYMLSCLL